ncbi:MAG: PIN domain-containing protein [Salinibacter sp.]|uniref:PIN domain-containing protein n=1 Tax=Salinibacter sp. TaxID=2065818 RepID=UPI0035D4080A
MTGIDTNILVRYITRDDPEQYRAAKSFLESDCTQEEPGYVNVIVLCELAWVLTSVYDATDEELTGVLDQLLRTRQLQIERRDQVRLALGQYKRSAAGFPDCLLGQLNQHEGCEETVTFDQDASDMDGWRTLDG